MNISTIKPLDEALVAAEAAKCGAVVTCEEHTVIGGLGGAVCECLAEKRPTPVLRIGIQDDEIEIMGVRVPHQLMPIKPGRNLAIIVEVAARNLSLKRTGYNAARELSSLFQDDAND